MATYGYQPWVAHNHTVITNSINLFVEATKKHVILLLRQVCDVVLDYIEGKADITIPIYTGNLHDATGIVLYVDGFANYMRFPNKIATKKQSTGPSLGSRRYIDGHEFLRRSFFEGETVFNKGVWIVLYSAVPYAAHIDTLGSPLGRGKDYFWDLRTGLERTLRFLFKSGFKKYGVFNV